MNRGDLSALLGFEPSDEQWAAISAPLDAPLLVLAGAGSGKTAVMSARVLWLVGSGQVEPDQVLGLTFTNKAAGELGSRVRSLLAHLPSPGIDPVEPTISTYHSFAMDLLAEYGLLIGAEPSATLLNSTDLAVATYRTVANSTVACEELGTSNLATLRRRIQALDEQLSEHLVDTDELRDHDRRFQAMLSEQKPIKVTLDMADAARRRIIASQVVQEVRAAREAEAQVSFADLMRSAVEISAVPRVREEMRSRFRAVLVDEYQDTSVAQAQMLENLFGEGFALTAVGDPLQAIYGWRGASVANIDGFPDRFDAAVSTLSTNRRSGSLILDVANAVAADVRAQHPGVDLLRPLPGDTGSVEIAVFDSWLAEADWLVDRIREQSAAGRPLEQIAVLCRTNAYVEDIAARLREAEIPVAAASLGSVLNVPEVSEVLSMLRVLDKADNASLVRLLTGPQWRIGPSDLAVLGERARRLAATPSGDEDLSFEQQLEQALAQTDPVETVSLLEAVYDPGPDIGEEARERLRQLAEQLDAIRPALVTGVEEAAHRIVETSGLAVEVRLGPAAQTRMEGLAALFDLIGDYRAGHDDPSVSSFLMWLDRAEELSAMPEVQFPVRSGAVQVMSVHRAKGLEWECVFVPALADGVFPSSEGRDPWITHYSQLPYPLRGDRDRLPVLSGWSGAAAGGGFTASVSSVTEDFRKQCKQQDAWEEARLAYVALTRAKQVLVASGHWWSRTGSQKKPSPYLETIRDVPGVVEVTWVEELPDKPPGLERGDLAWPLPNEVYADIAAPAEAVGELSEQERQRLKDLDTDIQAVIEREMQQSRPTEYVDVPAVLSPSLLMRAASDREALALDLARPMPRVTTHAARRGTAFHEWVARESQQLSLIPDWETALDEELGEGDDLAELIEGYRRTPYAQMKPEATEKEIMVRIAGMAVRGFVDAVFQHPDGTWEVVDWKTSADQDADPLQLAIYRLGWAQRVGVSPEDVLTAFVYVRSGEVVRPEVPDLEQVEELVRGLQ